MADPSRGGSGPAAGAQREDQLLRAPAFRDPQDADPLIGSDQASWHGSTAVRHVIIAGALIVAASFAAFAMMAAVEGPIGPDAGATGPLGAEGDAQADPVPDLPAQGSLPDPALPSLPGNATVPPVPLPDAGTVVP